MCTVDGEIRVFIMIEQPCFPGVGVVAGFAVSTEPGLMRVIGRMAMIAARLGITVYG